MRKVLVVDTSMLCCWLQVPGKDKAGSGDDQWDFGRVDAKIREEIDAKTTLVLPLASIIETGNHIAQSRGDRYTLAGELAKIMMEAADNCSPWAAFTDQSELWDKEGLKQLAQELPKMAAEQTSIGDTSIKIVAEYYSKMRFCVEIFTADAGLKSYESQLQQVEPPIAPPRRRGR